MTVPILLLGLGLLLILVDVLFPTAGIASILAGIAIVWALVIAFREGVNEGLTFLAAVAVLVPTAIVGGLKLFPKSPVGKRVVIGGLSFESTVATDPRDLELVGRTGVVLGGLRPAGHARIDGRRVDVVSRGEPIEDGEPVRVIEVRGNRVVVAPLPPEEAAARTETHSPGEPHAPGENRTNTPQDPAPNL